MRWAIAFLLVLAGCTQPLQMPQADWSWDAVRAPQAHARGVIGSGVEILMLDTGVGGIRVEGMTVNQQYANVDETGHGTAVATLIKGGGAIDGIAPGATVSMYDVCPETCSSFHVAKALEFAAKRYVPYDIVSVSLNGQFLYQDTLIEHVRTLAERGTAVVVSLGNAGDQVNGLSSMPGVISVAGTDPDGRVPHRAPTQAACQCLVIGAPGHPVWVDQWLWGSSFAVAYVTGALALAIEAHCQGDCVKTQCGHGACADRPTVEADQPQRLRDTLRATVGPDTTGATYGHLDAAALVDQARRDHWR